MTIVQHTYYDFKQEATPSLLASALKYAQAQSVQRPWKQIINILGVKRDGRFVEIKRGSKLPVRKGWNQTENTLSAREARAHLVNGFNIGLTTGTGGLYVIDFDNNAERGHECDQLSGGLYTYRQNAPHKAKFVFYCQDTIPTRLKSKSSGIDLLGVNSNGTHAQAVIAGIHDSGAPIQWGGHTVPTLPVETVAALWEQWTGTELFAAESEDREPSAIYAGADLERIADALKYIDADDIDYNTWQGIIAAIHDSFGDDALDIVVDWANGRAGEVEAKWNTYDREYTGNPATLKTVFYLARKGGWPDDWTQEQLDHYRQWLASPECIEELRNAGFKNTEQARKLLDSILQKCEEMKSLSIAPGYAYLSRESTIALGGLSRYLARLFTSSFINLQMGQKAGEATRIELLPKSVCRNVNSIMTTGRAIHVVTNWNIYREQRPSEAFMNSHYAYNVTRTKATLPTLGANGLGALLQLLDGPATIKEIAETANHSYRTMARTLSRYEINGMIDVEVGDRGLKTYILKAEWREILKANLPKMPTYAVQLGRRVDALKSRESILQFKGELEKAEKIGEERERMEVLLAKVKEAAGIIPFPRSTNTTVDEDLSALSIEQLAKEDPDKAHRTPRPTTIRFDAVEEWRTWGFDMWETLQCFGDIDLSEKIRLLTVFEVGEDASAETYRNVRREIAERVERTLSLAPRRASLERAYTHPDAEEDDLFVPVAPTSLFAMPHIYA
jgi:DNA-binding transcriptional ArsR family regulator